MKEDVSAFSRSTHTVDASPWLFIGTTVFCFSVMIFVVPLLVSRNRKRQSLSKDNPRYQGPSFHKIMAHDDETRAILQLVAPYTVSSVSREFFSNCVLILVAQFIGTREVAAYALVHILVELSNGILMGPVYACITLCSHALGADNYLLSGQYLQLAISLYIGLNIPVLYFWWHYTYEAILWLHWGDEATALLAGSFVQSFIWAIVLNGITQSIAIIWSITEHAFARSILEVTRDGGNVVILVVLFLNLPEDQISLQLIGIVYSVISLLFLALIVGISHFKGWIQPFEQGLFQRLAIVDNFPALQLLIATATPLSGGELLAHAEWAVLTFFASFLGPAEVAAWAILGNIWDLFYCISEGVGEAAEIRISLHLGDNHPSLAQLSTYKSLLIGSASAVSVSVFFFGLKDVIPPWFTSDPTLQQLLKELVPFVGVANLTMMFGMNCWFVLGAQGKYGLATWITALCSWSICVPLSALYILVWHFDLQGLASALSIGYVTSGACLSYFTMVTDWSAVALKISTENAEEEVKSNDDDRDDKDVLASETSALLPANV